MCVIVFLFILFPDLPHYSLKVLLAEDEICGAGVAGNVDGAGGVLPLPPSAHLCQGLCWPAAGKLQALLRPLQVKSKKDRKDKIV